MLVVSASDFVADGWLHGRMAVLRGVEGALRALIAVNKSPYLYGHPFNRDH